MHNLCAIPVNNMLHNLYVLSTTLRYIGMHDHVQQSFSSSLTHRYYIRHAGNCPVLSVNIESMGDVTSGVAHACGASEG